MALEVKENGKYKNIEMKDLGYETSCTMRLKFDECKKGERPNKFEKDEKGQSKMQPYFLYNVTMIEPNFGDVSFFAPTHLHKDLEKFKSGDVVKLTAKETTREFTIQGKKTKRSYKGFAVEKVALKMSEEDLKKFAADIKQLRTEGAVTSDEDIKGTMAEMGYTDAEDVAKVIGLSR